MPQVTKIFLKLREMGVDVPADVYTIPYAVKMILEAKPGGMQGRPLSYPGMKNRKGVQPDAERYYHRPALPRQQPRPSF